MAEAVFLRRLDGSEVFLGQAPVHMTPGMGESLETRPVSEEELAQLSDASQLDFLVWDYTYAPVSKRDLPTELVYDVLDLQKHYLRDRGLIRQKGFYDHYVRSTDSYHGLAVQEVWEYEFMPGTRQLPLRRVKKIRFYLRNKTVGFVKEKTTEYVNSDPAKVHEKRKNANVMNIKAILFDRFVKYYTHGAYQALQPSTPEEEGAARQQGYTQGLNEVNALFFQVKSNLDTYIEGHEGYLLDQWLTLDQEALNSPISPGLPVSIKDFVYNELDIPYV